MSISVIEQAKIQAQVLVPPVKALQASDCQSCPSLCPSSRPFNPVG